jgi:hypothetical protein
MADFAKMLREHAASDHKRGCQGRCYSCECGHDLATDQRLLEAADKVDVLVKALEEEREYWAGQIASAMIRQDPCDDMQDRCDGITRVLDAVGTVGEKS